MTAMTAITAMTAKFGPNAWFGQVKSLLFGCICIRQSVISTPAQYTNC